MITIWEKKIDQELLEPISIPKTLVNYEILMSYSSQTPSPYTCVVFKEWLDGLSVAAKEMIRTIFSGIIPDNEKYDKNSGITMSCISRFFKEKGWGDGKIRKVFKEIKLGLNELAK